MVNVQVTGLGWSLAADTARAAVAGKRGPSLASPVASVFTSTAPAGAVGGIIGTQDRKGAAFAGAVEVHVLASDRGRHTVGLAAAFASDKRLCASVTVDGGTVQGAENVIALLLAGLGAERDATFFADKRVPSGCGAVSDLMLAGAENVVDPKALHTPAVYLDSGAAECTGGGQQIVDACPARSGPVSLGVSMRRMVHDTATTASA